MRIAALFGVKDEIELVRASIEHLRAIGVDLIVAFDAGSTDGTREVLDAFEARDVFQIIDGAVLSADERRERQLALAREAKADWVFFVDADEFWLPAGGSLKDCESLANADVLNVDRYNVPPTRIGPLVRGDLAPSSYKDVFLCVQRIPAFHTAVADHPVVPWIVGADILPKVLARTSAIRAMAAGGHWVEPAGDQPLRQVTPRDLVIAHAPFSTFDRFERKVVNICERMRTHPEFFRGNNGWHWLRWAELFRAGTLAEEFKRQMLSEERVATLIASGAIITAADIFAQRSD